MREGPPLVQITALPRSLCLFIWVVVWTHCFLRTPLGSQCQDDRMSGTCLGHCTALALVMGTETGKLGELKGWSLDIQISGASHIFRRIILQYFLVFVFNFCLCTGLVISILSPYFSFLFLGVYDQKEDKIMVEKQPVKNVVTSKTCSKASQHSY